MTTLNPLWLKVERSRNLVHGQVIFMEIALGLILLKDHRTAIAENCPITHPYP